MSTLTADQRTAAGTSGVRPSTRRAARRGGSPNGMDYNSRTGAFRRFSLIVLIVFAAIWLIPILFAIDTSLKPEGEIAAHPASWWSGHFNLDAYRAVIDSTPILTWYVNSLLVAVISVVLTLIVTSMLGFALAQTRFRGRGAVLGLVLAGLIIPGQILVLPLYQEVQAFHLLNTYWALALPAATAPVAVFIFESFFAGLPVELVDAARIDGASWFQIYRSVCLPLCKPAVAAVGIFTFVASWNNFLWPLLVMSSIQTMTVPVGMATVQGGFGILYAQVMATAVLGALPLFVVFLLFQRQIVEGVAATGIK